MVNRKLEYILSIPRSLYINLRLFGFFEGGGIPVLISNQVKCRGLRRGAIKLGRHVFGSIKIGFGGSEGIQAQQGSIIIGEHGSIVFEDNASIGRGTSIRVENGVCQFGSGFSCNKNCFISCTKGVTFGKQDLLGWNVSVRDDDGHIIVKDGIKKCSSSAVVIGEHVWIASFADILKGVHIGSGRVVGYRSCLTKSVEDQNVLIAGFPAKVIQQGIDWIR